LQKPIDGPDRRKAQRRSGTERRAVEKLRGVAAVSATRGRAESKRLTEAVRTWMVSFR